MSAETPNQTDHAPPQQSERLPNRVFARIEELGARVGLAVVLLAALGFTAGWLAPYLPVERLVASWHLPAAEFIQVNAMPTGWHWLRMLGYGDMLGLGGLALLAAVAPVAYLVVLPVLLRERDFLFAGLAALQLAVFLLAAGGWLAAD